MAENVPRKRRCPGADTLGTSKTGDRGQARPNASLYSTRQPAIRSTAPLYDFADILDVIGTLSADAANKLAAVARLLADHDREIGGLGADVATVARMATTALQAAQLLHQVQGEYQDWMVTP